MPLAQARALFETGRVRVLEHDPDSERAALRRLAVWAQRFSPIVAIDHGHNEEQHGGQHMPSASDGLLIDVTGCAPVFRGERRLARQAVEGLAGLGFTARVAIAPSYGCARALARFGPFGTGGPGADRFTIIEPPGVRAALEPLPVASLGIDRGTVDQLARVGIERVGEVLALPRSALPARFGEGLLLALDRALGHAIETIDPVRPVPPPAVQHLFDGATDRPEVIELAARALLEGIAGELERRGCGARTLAVELERPDLAPERVAITLGRPSRDAGHLWALVRPGLERAHLGHGVGAVRVRVGSVGRLRHEQVEFGPQGRPSDADAARAWDELADTLRNRLGTSRVRRAVLAGSHLPERAFAMVEGETPARARSGSASLAPGDRPTVLLDRPAPVRVIALTPDGPVHRVALDGETLLEVVACAPPERIAGEWWRMVGSGSDRTRDCFRVCLEDGRWVWLVRSIERGAWFVHGVWA